MTQSRGRWLEITPSPFAHEAEGLGRVKAIVPDQAPFRAWTNLEFRDGHGKWHEVDLLVLGRRRLHLVELKYYSGTLRGDDHRWLRDGHRAEDSPLKLARRKAQRLASRLQDELLRWAREHHQQIPSVREVVPYVQESVFLHHPGLRCALTPPANIDLFGIDGNESASGLPGISERLLEPATPHQVIGANRDPIIAALLANIGVVQRRQREVGSWVIDDEPIGEGDGWQDWPAFHRVATTDRNRVRFFVTAPGASREEETRVRRVVDHEFRVMTRLAHDGLLRPRDLVDHELGIGLVYPDDQRLQRLDLWLADQADRVPLADQLAIIRQVAEAVGYAHGSRVVHRGLTPQAVSVRRTADGNLRVVVGDWQSVGRTSAASSTAGTPSNVPSAGVTGLLGVDESGARPDAIDADRRQAEAFQAPEGVWNADADRVRLDVFALGALAYAVLAARPAAPDRASLRERLRRDDGLDLAADLAQVPSTIRDLVLAATRPVVTDRLPDVRSFLELLAAAERALSDPGDDAQDPLEATTGAVLGGRWRLERRLGAGSTAVGLLVTDLSVTGPEALRVLKVANDEPAAARLADEAEVLAGLNHPRLVRLIEGPIDIGGRRALLLDNAGEQTLGEVLRGRTRLSLDLLERFGGDLLEALVALDRAGVDHRDIKPANLGVREGRGDRTKHLVLFDFSLSRAGATALAAGTPPYLDPFLDSAGRGRYDSAAERYAAAVVLFEMATGATPTYGDGLTDPGLVPDEASIDEGMFDESVAGALVAFFRQALARDAAARHDTAGDMIAAWRAVFAPVPRTTPDDANARADAATASTTLAEAGLSARALSALEPYHVSTVGDLVALDPVRLNRLAGVADATRREVKDRARRWRERLGPAAPGHGAGHQLRDSVGLPTPGAAADLLLQHAGATRADARRSAARLILGLDGDLDPFASRAELARALDVSRARADQHVDALQQAWADHSACRAVLDALAGEARMALTALGDVATIEELTSAVELALAPTPPSGPTDGPAAPRIAAGLLRLALDRVHALDRADAGEAPLVTRRRAGRIALLATDPGLLDAAEALGRAADQLVAQAQLAQQPLVSNGRTATALRDTLIQALPDERPAPLDDDRRLVRLASALSQTAALSGADELHARDLAQVTALAIALAGVGGAAPVGAQELRARVRARFPAVASLPERPRLDELVDAAGLGLVYDDAARAYRSLTRAPDTTGLAHRVSTYVVRADAPPVESGHVGHRLAESRSSRSFLALGVDGRDLDLAVDTLARDYDAVPLDLTQVLIEAMRAAAEQVGLPWDAVRAADAAAAGSREAIGLATLVQRSLPAIDAAIEAAAAQADPATRPVLLLEAAPLARYEHLGNLSRWTDLTTPRRQAVWLFVPQLLGSRGAVLDTRPVPLAAPGQFVRLNSDWLRRRPVTQGAPA